MPAISETQSAIIDNARRVLSAYTSAVSDSREYASGSTWWKLFVSEGWAGMLVPESAGGFELSDSDAVVLLEECGCHLCPPWLGEILALTSALRESSEEALHALQTRILAGQCKSMLVLMRDHAIDGARIFATSEYSSGLSVLDEIVMSDGKGMVYLCARNIAGLCVETHRGVDGENIERIRLDGVRASDVRAFTLNDETGLEFGSRYETVRNLAAAAYLVGAAEKSFQLGLDYTKTRTQFGRPIASFQAIQHRAANLYVKIRCVRELVHAVASMQDGERKHRAAEWAAREASDVAVGVCGESVQFHGAIGFTDESSCGLFLKRVMSLSAFVRQERGSNSPRGHCAARLDQRCSGEPK